MALSDIYSRKNLKGAIKNKMIEKTINILGTEYKFIDKVERGKDLDLENNFGICCYYQKVIKIVDIDTVAACDNETRFDKESLRKETIRHELIHAFIYESGLRDSSHSPQNWGQDEEIIDWFAVQMPKIFKIMTELGVI